MKQEYRSGFITLIGSPNVGKSTLLNRMVGQKVSIVSQRVQTTRSRVMGVLTRPGFQIVFLDTPGVTTPQNRLGEYMLRVAYDAISEVEAVLFMVDATAGIRQKDEAVLARLKEAKAPVLAVINKVDRASMADMEALRARLEREEFLDGVMAVSALEGDGVEALLKKLEGYLVAGPQYFPENMVTDQPERVLCAELIREKALLLLRQEVPHGLGVSVDKMELRPDGIYDIWATLYCEREGHKGIIIGRGGAMLKQIGTLARRDVEWMLDARVNLQLWVKVKEDWRNSLSTMRELGYEQN